jgi:hypothetical protein
MENLRKHTTKTSVRKDMYWLRFNTSSSISKIHAYNRYSSINLLGKLFLSSLIYHFHKLYKAYCTYIISSGRMTVNGELGKDMEERRSDPF